MFGLEEREPRGRVSKGGEEGRKKGKRKFCFDFLFKAGALRRIPTEFHILVHQTAPAVVSFEKHKSYYSDVCRPMFVLSQLARVVEEQEERDV